MYGINAMNIGTFEYIDCITLLRMVNMSNATKAKALAEQMSTFFLNRESLKQQLPEFTKQIDDSVQNISSIYVEFNAIADVFSAAAKVPTHQELLELEAEVRDLVLKQDKDRLQVIFKRLMDIHTTITASIFDASVYKAKLHERLTTSGLTEKAELISMSTSGSTFSDSFMFSTQSTMKAELKYVQAISEKIDNFVDHLFDTNTDMNRLSTVLECNLFQTAQLDTDAKIKDEIFMNNVTPEQMRKSMQYDTINNRINTMKREIQRAVDRDAEERWVDYVF